jgi:thioredoxin-related protein
MMKLRFIALAVLALSLMSFDVWRTDFDKARYDARSQHKLILLKFSGSDWCVPCIRMEKELFSRDTFSHFADKSLVMVNADFPRLSRNKQGKTVQTQNEMLAERYNKEGHFPYTVLLNADGKILKAWDGYAGMKPEELIAQINAIR